MLANLNPITGIINAGTGLVKAVIGDKSEREASKAKLIEKMEDTDASVRKAAIDQFAKEFIHPPKTLWDSFINGVNRIPRPAITGMCIYLVVIAIIDPEQAKRVYEALSVMPDYILAIVSGVFMFFFGGRIIDKRK